MKSRSKKQPVRFIRTLQELRVKERREKMRKVVNKQKWDFGDIFKVK